MLQSSVNLGPVIRASRRDQQMLLNKTITSCTLNSSPTYRRARKPTRKTIQILLAVILPLS